MLRNCVVCGGEFETKTTKNTCSETCRKQKNKNRNQKWNSKNTTYFFEYNRRWRARNPEKVSETSRKCYVKNLESRRERGRINSARVSAAMRLVKEIEANGLGALL